MGPDDNTDDTLEEQTLAFLPPDGWDPSNSAGEPVHLLLLLDDNAPPRRYPLHSLPVVIGRTPPADMVLEGTTVSRRHCRFELQDGCLRVRDLGSTNGTFLNGARLDAPAALEDGAIVSVGAYRLRYHRRAQDESRDADAMDEELREAGKYVASILPRPLDEGQVRANWFYRPSTRIGGDAFGYQMLDGRHFSLFLLDVSGHGTGAAMHAMTVAQVLRERVLPNVDFLDPAAVVGGLNSRFQMDRNNNLFFTIWYGVYDTVERVMAFASGGHHAAYLLPAQPGAWAPLPLETHNPVVGMLPDAEIASAEVEVPIGSTLHLFSDGVFEVTKRDGGELSLEDIVAMLPETMDADGGPDEPRRLYDRVRAIARPGPLDDDFSVLVFRFP